MRRIVVVSPIEQDHVQDILDRCYQTGETPLFTNDFTSLSVLHAWLFAAQALVIFGDVEPEGCPYDLDDLTEYAIKIGLPIERPTLYYTEIDEA